MQICSTNEGESKIIIVKKGSTEEDKSECVHKNNNKTKYAKNEAEYEEYSVTNEVPSCFNIFEFGRNLWKILDVTYERACTATQKEEYYTYLLENMIEHNYRSKTPLSKEKLWQVINMIVAETEE